MSTLAEAGNEKLLFDCGRGAPIRLAQLGVPFEDVDKLFITHMHSDHLVGIPDVWLTGWIMGRRTRPFQVWGPEGTQAMMSYLEKAFTEDIRLRRDVFERFPDAGISVQAYDITEGVPYQQDGVRITAFLVDHGPIKPSFGFRLDWGEFSVCLSGDTKPSENLIRHCEGVDVLIHEGIALEWAYKHRPATMSEELIQQIVRTLHTTPEEAGQIFKRVNPRLAVFSHTENDEEASEELLAGARKHYSGPVVVGQDLMQIEIGKEIVVRKGNEVLLKTD